MEILSGTGIAVTPGNESLWEERRLVTVAHSGTIFCIDCYKRYYICSYRAVCHRLGSIARAAKKALYAHGGKQNAIRDTESTLFALTCPDLARFVLIFHVLTRRDLN